ncbi:MAG: sulfur carrier protein ThiS [Actinomycetota bacterium]|nr:sulfur carrier protein ThiS [Actinomycetota bacterium]
MVVFVNGQPHEVRVGTTIAGLVEILGTGHRGVAVAVAAEVVARSSWDRVELAEGDRVEVLRAVQGGCQ